MAGDMAMLQPFALQEVLALRALRALGRRARAAGAARRARPADRARTTTRAARRSPARARRPRRRRNCAAFEASAARVPKDAMYSTVNPAPLVLDVARLDLAARIADARGDGAPADCRVDARRRRRGQGRLRRAARLAVADARRPGRGADARRATRPKPKRCFAPTSSKNRQNPRSLFGLWKALERQGKTAEAAKAKAEFDAAWAGDVTLTDIDLARARRRTVSWMPGDRTLRRARRDGRLSTVTTFQGFHRHAWSRAASVASLSRRCRGRFIPLVHSLQGSTALDGGAEESIMKSGRRGWSSRWRWSLPPIPPRSSTTPRALTKFRADRETTLKADNGWLTVAGLHFLNQGDNRVGSDPTNDIVLDFPARAEARRRHHDERHQRPHPRRGGPDAHDQRQAGERVGAARRVRQQAAGHDQLWTG